MKVAVTLNKSEIEPYVEEITDGENVEVSLSKSDIDALFDRDEFLKSLEDEMEKAKKAKDDNEDEDEKEKDNDNEDDEEEKDNDDEDDEEKAKKSLVEDEDFEVAYEVSDFLKSLVEKVSNHLDEIKKSIDKTNKRIDKLEKSINDIEIPEMVKSEKIDIDELSKSIKDALKDVVKTEISEIKEEMDDVKKSIEEIESKPAPKRNVPVTYVESPMAKSAIENNQLSKAEVLNILEQELYKSTGNITSNEILTYEVSGTMTPRIANVVKQYLKK